MRWLMVAVVGMGVLIVAGVATLGVVVVSRMSAPVSGNASAALDEPAGTRITGASLGLDRVLVQLQGGGPDRLVVIDLKSGRVLNRVGLAR